MKADYSQDPLHVRLSQLLKVVPLYKIPPNILYRKLCCNFEITLDKKGLYCYHEHFYETLIELLPADTKGVAHKVYEEIFNLIDLNRDDKIDINELGRSTYQTYRTQLEGNLVISSWKKLTNLDYYSSAELHKLLLTLSNGDTPAVSQALRDINKENSEVVTIWQVLRATGKTGHRIFLDIMEFFKPNLQPNTDSDDEILNSIQIRKGSPILS